MSEFPRLALTFQGMEIHLQDSPERRHFIELVFQGNKVPDSRSVQLSVFDTEGQVIDALNHLRPVTTRLMSYEDVAPALLEHGVSVHAQQDGADVSLMWGRFGFFLLRQEREDEEEKGFTQVVLGPCPACIEVDRQDGNGFSDRDFTGTLFDWSEVEKALDENYGVTVSAMHLEPSPGPRL